MSKLPISLLPLIVVACSPAAEEMVASTNGCNPTNLTGSDFYQSELLQPDSPHIMIVAHRACWHSGPENSLSAIEACIDAGIDMVELDVRRTKDNQLVLIHDETVDRTTGEVGNVGDFTLAQLTAMQLRTGEGGSEATLTDEVMPSLEQALRAARGRILVNVDAKEDVIDQAMAMVEELGMGDQVLMKGVFEPETLAQDTASIQGRAHFMPILWEKDSELPLNKRIEPYLETDPVAFELVYDSNSFLTTGSPSLEEADVRIWVNTMLPRYSAGLADEQALTDPDSVWGELVSAGADMIQTDRPIEALEYLRTTGSRCDI